MLQIRKALPNDIPSIALMARITFDEAFGHLFTDRQDLLDYFDKTFSISKLANSLQKKDQNVFWIAEWNDLPVGYAKLKLNSTFEDNCDENICQLQKIYVLKDFHSKKIGYNLQNQLLEEAKNLGNEKIWLSVYANNEKAINFYLKNAFEKAGTHTFQIGKEQFDFLMLMRNL